MQRLKCILVSLVWLSVGVTAALAEKSESQEAPRMTGVTPDSAFVSEKVTIRGEGLDVSGIRFSLGKTELPMLKQEPLAVVVQIPDGARSGRIKMVADGASQTLKEKLTIQKTPEIKKCPVTVPSSGEFRVTGKNLNSVDRWMLGKLELSVIRQTNQKVTLGTESLPEEEAPISMVLSSGTRLVPQPPIIISVVRTPVVEAVGYSSMPDGKNTFRGAVIGKNFTAKSQVKVNGKSAEVEQIEDDGNILIFTFRGKIPKRMWKLQISNGDVKAAEFTANGKAEGLQLTAKEVTAALRSEPVPMSERVIQMEYGMITDQINRIMKGMTPLADDASPRAASQRGKDTAAVFDAMKRLRVLQGSVCHNLKPGNEVAEENEQDIGLLEEMTRMLEQLSVDGLGMLWRDMPGDVLKKQYKKLGVAPSALAMNELVESRFLPWRACHQKVYGKDKKSAEELVRKELEHNLWDGFVALHTGLITDNPDRRQYEKVLKKMLKPLPVEQRDFWQGKLLSTYDKYHAQSSEP
jgi:hypothetical protein